MTDHNEELPVPEFFENDQAIGLIALIDREHGNIKAELADKVDLSDKVLKNLLDDAIAADLIEETQIRPGDHPRSDRYQLTTRGKAVQSLLRGMGLDDVQRDYIDRKNELEDTVPDVKGIIEAENLQKKYPQQDSWIRTGATENELDREQLLEDAEEVTQDQSDTRRPQTRDSGEPSADVLNDDKADDLSPKETWGNPSEEENNSNEE